MSLIFSADPPQTHVFKFKQTRKLVKENKHALTYEMAMEYLRREVTNKC